MARVKRTPRTVVPKINLPEEEVLEKEPTGISGLDEITNGGLPRGRPTLVAGGPGSGKTVLAMEFIVKGALEYGEPGVFMSFEENEIDLTKNFASLGWDLDAMITHKQLLIDYVYVERKEIEETGEYDLEGLFIRLGSAIDEIGAKRVALDTIEALFSGFTNQGILRAELRRLFRWLKEKGVTVIVTGERGEDTITRYGLEEYVVDAVIILDHRMRDQIATRRLRVVKYRGSLHGTNEYPFLIDESGFSVLPITSLGLEHGVSNERISSGIERLDTMLGGKGYYRGSSILVSGTAGTGKTSLAAAFVDAAARRGERCLYFAFEESPKQIIRNMQSIGINLQPWADSGILKFSASRPSLYGLEMHLVTMHKQVQEFNPGVVVVDPISNLITAGTESETRSMMTRLIDFLKANQITALFTSLTLASPLGTIESSEVGISSLMDNWILLKETESNGERNRLLYVLKARGMAHSNQVREFLLTNNGIQLKDVYAGPGGVLTGSARTAQEAEEKARLLRRRQEIEAKQREIERKRQLLEAQITEARAKFEEEKAELEKVISQDQLAEKVLTEERKTMAAERRAD